MKNQLVNGCFQLVPVVKTAEYKQKEELVDGEPSGDIFLELQLCDHTTHKSGILIADKDYSQGRLSSSAVVSKVNLDTWFLRAKKSLLKHISSKTHTDSEKEIEKKKHDLVETIDNMKKTVRHLVYCIIKTNTAFLKSPTLLATAFQCGLQIVDINYTRNFACRILPLINGVLEEDTKE